MSLLRCPKFLRCLTADAGNFDRGHSLTSLPLPLAALGSLPTGALRPRNDKTGFPHIFHKVFHLAEKTGVFLRGNQGVF